MAMAMAHVRSSPDNYRDSLSGEECGQHLEQLSYQMGWRWLSDGMVVFIGRDGGGYQMGWWWLSDGMAVVIRWDGGGYRMGWQ